MNKVSANRSDSHLADDDDPWRPDSWRGRPAAQVPVYPDRDRLSRALGELRQLPPLVTSWEIENLREQLAEVAEGKRFLLQGGDCAESFEECRPDIITGKLKILLQMSVILIHGSRKPVIRVGRFAGQYAKPRSSDTETRGGVTLPSYRGDVVNRAGFTVEERTPNPDLLLEGYHKAALTLNFIRSLVEGGFADLHHPEYWQLEFVRHSQKAAQYQRMKDEIWESVRFLEIVSGRSIDQFSRVEFFCSHEGLLLDYEEAQTRHVPRRTGWYNLSTHFPWIGNRTRDRQGAHVEYFRGIANPIGIKLGAGATPEELTTLIERLDPQRCPGRITLIHRFGEEGIAKHLPPLIAAIQKTHRRVVWCCDPMHGNTETVTGGYKTRDFQRILSELEQAFDIHARAGSYLGGVHFELTGDDVTECTGGARGLRAEDLARDYRTQVDPRLNCEQSLEMAMLMAQRMRQA